MSVIDRLARGEECGVKKIVSFKSKLFDETIYMVMLTAKEFIEILKHYPETADMDEGAKASICFLARVLCDVDGNLLFTDNQDALWELPMPGLQELVDRGLELCGGSKGIDAVKND